MTVFYFWFWNISWKQNSKSIFPLASTMRIRLVLPFSGCLITLRVFIFWLKLPRHDNPHSKLAHLIINWVSKCAKSQHSKQVWRCFYSISYYYREYVLPAGRFIYMQFICNWVVSEYRNTRKHCQTDQTFARKYTEVYGSIRLCETRSSKNHCASCMQGSPYR